MPKNLREKLNLLIQDTKDLGKAETIRAIENLVNQELGYLEATYEVDSYDLNLIKSSAVKKFVDRDLSQQSIGSMSGDNDMIRSMFYVESVIEYLRGKGLIKFTMTFKKK